MAMDQTPRRAARVPPGAGHRRLLDGHHSTRGDRDGSLKVAAYQAPLLPSGSTNVAVSLIREQVQWCESEGVEILCCPEGVLGGLADYATQPAAFAIDVESGELQTALAPLASN